jgi:hypothetical protein
VSGKASSSVFFRLRSDGRAVSGVVAASLGVVLISVLLSMVVTFWVPAWGYDNEVDHSRRVLNAFGQFKNAVELQTLSGNSDQTVTTTLPLGVGGVPLFGAETPGALSYAYLEGGKVRFRANLTDALGQVNLSGTGSLKYTIPNRYYDRQGMAYESGGVIVEQAGGSAMRLPPPIRVTNASQGLEVVVTLFSLEGTQGLVTGVESHTVSSRLTVAYTQNYTWAPNNTLYLNVTTQYRQAWASYFNASLSAAAVNASLFNVSTVPAGAPELVSLRLSGVRTLIVTVALVNIRID